MHIGVRNFPKFVFLVLSLFLFSARYNYCSSQEIIKPETHIISGSSQKNCFTLSSAGVSASISISEEEFPGIVKAVGDLQTDISAVSGARPVILSPGKEIQGNIILIGSLQKNPLIRELASQHKIDISILEGKWESFLIQVVSNPFPGVSKALVIAGSDKRGTIYGIYELSSQIGVSPWYWWADVPVKKQSELYVLPGPYSMGEPAVKYRGIFLNDEAPALSGWTHEKFGGFNHLFYEKVFELILRLKGNYLWPAMWGNAFNTDDTLNPVLADEYGIVMGTSHHEPMMRAQQEWKIFGSGPWNYESNQDVLKEFWKNGIRNNGTRESIVTIGMRGDGDMPMSEENNISLLERIVKDQRLIIEEVSGKDPSKTPQMWALYKEVQEYYDKGMRVPDDVTLLFCDDNWGNIRKLPDPNSPARSGGYGVYYHFDYVGDPRNYKWINTNQIERAWEQMNLAYQYGARQVWIVNVGDLKPMEFPIQFFLDYAWNPENYPADKLPDYYENWVRQQFGSYKTREIASILQKYSQFNSRCKPELLSPETYSIFNYREFETIVNEYYSLSRLATDIYDEIPTEYKDAFYQLILYPVLASANLNDLYFSVALNHWYALQGRASANDMAERAKILFDKDAQLSRFYNDSISNGKWSHMMDQTHIGYTYWQQPDKNTMPEVMTIQIPEKAEMGVSIEGFSQWWPQAKEEAKLPVLYPRCKPETYIELFDRGKTPFQFKVETGAEWLKITPGHGILFGETRLKVNVDWQNAPTGINSTVIKIFGPDEKALSIEAKIHKFAPEDMKFLHGFMESEGVLAMEAEHYTKKTETDSVKWLNVPGLGRTLSGMTIYPATSRKQNPGGNSPCLEYDFYIFESGKMNVEAYLSPGLDFTGRKGLCFGLSIDDSPIEIINLHKDVSPEHWRKTVAENIVKLSSGTMAVEKGSHTLKYWMVDPGIVLQRLVINAGGLKPSYLGPPESTFIPENP